MKNKAERNPNIALLLALALVIAPLAAQQKPDPQAQSATQVTALEEHIDQMAARIESMRQELIDSRDEMRAMRAELEELRHIIGERDSREADAAAASLRANIEKLREDSEVLQAEVKQHDQTKIETESKFPVQISGSVLFTSLGNSGASDNVDAPTIAMAPPSSAPAGSLTATARQTILGLDANGPHFGSARTSAALSVDFFGGVPYAETTTAGGGAAPANGARYAGMARSGGDRRIRSPHLESARAHLLDHARRAGTGLVGEPVDLGSSI